jgi:hypothetical protein
LSVLRQHATIPACITLAARSASANLLSQTRISVPSCLEKGKFRAICKPTTQLGLATEACNGRGDLAQSTQALSAATHHEPLRFQFDAALELQVPSMGMAGSSEGKNQRMTD